MKILRPIVMAAALLPTTAMGDFLETWESPAMPAGGGITAYLPSPWTKFSGGNYDSIVARPTDTYGFPQIDPLSPPAGGNQYLVLIGENTGVSRMSGVTIAADSTYTLSAAIGNARTSDDDQSWSLQLWADSNGNGVFDGGNGDFFIGQQFGTNPGATNATAGSWALNSFSFDSSTLPNLVGLQLIVFLNNYGPSESYYDNVSLIGPAAVPEPASLAMLVLGGLAAGVAVRRSRRTG